VVPFHLQRRGPKAKGRKAWIDNGCGSEKTIAQDTGIDVEGTREVGRNAENVHFDWNPGQFLLISTWLQVNVFSPLFFVWQPTVAIIFSVAKDHIR
jgi:hypothetical protein